MVKFVWVKFINVCLVNRKHKPCALTGTAHSPHTEGKKNGLLFAFITPCLYEALIFTLGSFLPPLYVMVVYWRIFIKCSVLKLIRRSEPGTFWLPVFCISIEQQLSYKQHNFPSFLINVSGCPKTVTETEAGQRSLLGFEAPQTCTNRNWEGLSSSFCCVLNLPFLPSHEDWASSKKGCLRYSL